MPENNFFHLVALIAFGFTIYRLMNSLHKSGMAILIRPQEPRNLGLTLIALGTFSLLAESAWIPQPVPMVESDDGVGIPGRSHRDSGPRQYSCKSRRVLT